MNRTIKYTACFSKILSQNYFWSKSLSLTCPLKNEVVGLNDVYLVSTVQSLCQVMHEKVKFSALLLCFIQHRPSKARMFYFS